MKKFLLFFTVVIFITCNMINAEVFDGLWNAFGTCSKYKDGDSVPNSYGVLETRIEIKGWENDKCVVDSYFNNSHNLKILSTCKYSESQIKEIMRAENRIQKKMEIDSFVCTDKNL